MVSKVSKKSLKIISVTFMVIAIIAILVGKIYSTNDNHYVLDVVQETATNNDGKLQITEKIVKESGQDFFNSKELDYEVELKNIAKADKEQTEVAIVVDTSYSIETNDVENKVKDTAAELAKGIVKNVKSSKVSISNNSAIKLNMAANNDTNIQNTINALKFGEGNDSNKGLDFGVQSFTKPGTPNTINKYMIVFTDATDHVADKMRNILLENQDVKIISVLVDMTSNSYIDAVGDNICGDVYLLLSELKEDNAPKDIPILDLEAIYDELNNTVSDVTVENIFSEEVQKYFDIVENNTTSADRKFSINKLHSRRWKWNCRKNRYWIYMESS